MSDVSAAGEILSVIDQQVFDAIQRSWGYRPSNRELAYRLLAIDLGLEALFRNREASWSWLHASRDELNGNSPYQYLTAGTDDEIDRAAHVQQIVDRIRNVI